MVDLKNVTDKIPKKNYEQLMQSGKQTTSFVEGYAMKAGETVGALAGTGMNLAHTSVQSALAVPSLVTDLTQKIISEVTAAITESITDVTAYGAKMVIKWPIEQSKEQAKAFGKAYTEEMKSLTPAKLLIPTEVRIESDAIKQKVEEKTEKINQITSKVSKFVEKAQSIVEEAKKTIESITPYIEEGPDYVNAEVEKMLKKHTEKIYKMRDDAKQQITDFVQKTASAAGAVEGTEQGKKAANQTKAMLKAQLDMTEKMKSRVEIKVKQVSAVAVSKVAAMVGF